MNAEGYDAIIIGAGFSGISAGRMLHRQGLRILVLEANGRIGGRVYTKVFNGGLPLDLGGQWIGPTQNRMYGLVKEYGLSTYPTHDHGRHQVVLKGKTKSYSGLIPKIGLVSILDMGRIIHKLERLAESIPQENPLLHPQANEFNTVTLGDFVKKNTFGNNARSIISAGLETVFGCNANEISLLHSLFYMRSGNSLNHLLSTQNGAQQDRVSGGMQQLAERMAGPFMNNIRFGSRVSSIKQEGENVTVSGDGFSFSSKRAIVATPPWLTAKIDFGNILPNEKADAFGNIFVGRVAKCFGVYERPFWRDRGFSGLVVADDSSPFQAVFDASPADGQYGVLLGFCIADRHDAFFQLPEPERKSAAIRYFASCFGDGANQPLFYSDHSMTSEPFIGGCYAGLYRPGYLSRNGNILARAEGKIHFAGTETSDVWYGYIEGAVRAGERAATEIIEART